jgi:hypothetical protein
MQHCPKINKHKNKITYGLSKNQSKGKLAF